MTDRTAPIPLSTDPIRDAHGDLRRKLIALFAPTLPPCPATEDSAAVPW
jgi:hypothetical protein